VKYVSIEKSISSYIAIGAVGITLIITDRVNTEPVNIPKMLLLTGLAGAVLGMMLWAKVLLQKSIRNISFLILIFSILLISSSSLSSNPFERGFYGGYGRSTGALTYISLGLILLAVSTFKEFSSYIKIIKAFIIAAVANIIYSLFAGAGYDVFQWSNPFNGAVLGTFGNPNFIGAFMGIFVSTMFIALISYRTERMKLLITSLGILLGIIVIKLSDALQGAIIPIFGISALSLIYLKYFPKYKRVRGSAAIFYLLGFIVGGLGILNKGPLAQLLYKPSLTFRGEYWQAGINMGLEKPLFGVGIDSYGTYFRTFRNESATVLPGMDVTTDAAHNVFIDIFSGGGFPLLFLYLLLNIFVAITAIKHIKVSTKFDPYFTFFFVGWLTYTVQSIFSINQIGLAIWGWLFAGAIIGYSKLIPDQNESSRSIPKSKQQSSQQSLAPAGAVLSAFVGLVVGLLIALPPMVRDTQFRNIQTKSGDSQKLIDLANSWPLDSIRMNRASVLLANSGLNGLSAEVALNGTKSFPNDYAAWYTLYELSAEGSTERESYRKVLNRIDPFNTKYFDK
jgi:O-antigen ligase